MAAGGPLDARLLDVLELSGPEPLNMSSSRQGRTGLRSSGRLTRTTSSMPAGEREASAEAPSRPRSINFIGESTPKNRAPDQYAQPAPACQIPTSACIAEHPRFLKCAPVRPTSQVLADTARLPQRLRGRHGSQLQRNLSKNRRPPADASATGCEAQ